jgi:hypothetical protein
MLHPKQFAVNEAWIAFRLNSSPIRTRKDGDFDCIALMDAASCFILASDLFQLANDRSESIAIRRLFAKAKSHKQTFPKTLFVPQGDAAEVLVEEATRQNVQVVSVPESEVLMLIGEARQEFAERFEGRGDDA